VDKLLPGTNQVIACSDLVFNSRVISGQKTTICFLHSNSQVGEEGTTKLYFELADHTQMESSIPSANILSTQSMVPCDKNDLVKLSIKICQFRVALMMRFSIQRQFWYFPRILLCRECRFAIGLMVQGLSALVWGGIVRKFWTNRRKKWFSLYLYQRVIPFDDVAGQKNYYYRWNVFSSYSEVQSEIWKPDFDWKGMESMDNFNWVDTNGA